MTLAPANQKWVGLNTRRSVLGVTCNKPMFYLPSPLRAMSAFQLNDLIFWQLVCSLRWGRCIHEFQYSNCSVYGQIIDLIQTWNSVLFYNFRNTESSCKFRQRELNTYMILYIWYMWSCGRSCGYDVIMICGNITNIVCYQHRIHYFYRLVFIICMCPPFKIHCHGLYYALCVLFACV